MGNGMNKVIDGLYLGNIKDAENRDNLSENSITHILSVYNNPKPVFEDMKYLCIHAADASSQNLMQHFKECIGFIHECRLNGGACLVHCLAGASRSTTMVVAYLMTVTNYTWEDCLSAVKTVRSFVDPNPGFRDQLQKYQDTRLSEKKRPRLLFGFAVEQVSSLAAIQLPPQPIQRLGTSGGSTESANKAVEQLEKWSRAGMGVSFLPSGADHL